MKKLTPILILLFAIYTANSQPVLTGSMNPQIGDRYKVDFYEDVNNLDPGPQGANVTWNFSSVAGTYHQGDFYIVVDPATTPFYDSAAVAEATICVRPEDLSQGGIYEYAKCNNNLLETLAVASADASGAPVSFIKYTDPQIGMQYPFTMGDSYSDVHDGMMIMSNMGFYFWRDSSFVVTEADAYGSITTPAATYNNVIRIKRTTYQSTWNRFAPESPWMFMGMFQSVDYDWFNPSIGVNVFGIHKDLDLPTFDGVDVLTYYNSPVGLGDTEVSTNIQIAPNPAIDYFQVMNSRNAVILEYTLYDIAGNMVMHSAFDGQKINVSGLCSGHYIVELKSTQNVIRKQLIIQ
jgi:hypothetical protein